MQDPWENTAYLGRKETVVAKQGMRVTLQHIESVIRVGVLCQNPHKHFSCAMTPEQVRALRDALSEMLVEIEGTP